MSMDAEQQLSDRILRLEDQQAGSEEKLANGHTRLTNLESRMSSLEMKTAIMDRDLQTLMKSVDTINKNTTWILRIIIGSIVVGLLSLLFTQVHFSPKTATNFIQWLGGFSQ